eukprot:gene11369-12554_t
MLKGKEPQKPSISPTPLLPPEVPPHFSFKPATPARAHQPIKHKKSRKKKPEIDIAVEVHDLKTEVQKLQKQTLYLRENLEDERENRRQFEKMLRKSLRKVLPDLEMRSRESTLSTRSSMGDTFTN